MSDQKRRAAEAKLKEIEALCATLIHTGRALGQDVDGPLAHMPSELRARVEARLKTMEAAPVQTSAPQAVTWRWVALGVWVWLVGFCRRWWYPLLLTLVIVLGHALLLTGCGAEPRFTSLGRVGPLELQVEEGASSALLDRVTADVASARAAFESGSSTEPRWRLGPGEFDARLSGLQVRVHAGTLVRGRYGDTYVGLWDPGVVDLGCRGDALPHELMHELDFQAGNPLTSQHLGWDVALDEGMLAGMSHRWLDGCGEGPAPLDVVVPW